MLTGVIQLPECLPNFFNDVVNGKISPNDMCIVGTTGYFREMTFHAIEDWVDLDNPKVDQSMRGKSFSRVMTNKE